MDSLKDDKDQLADSKKEDLIESKAEKRKKYKQEYNSRYYQENAEKILKSRREKRQIKAKTDLNLCDNKGKNPNDSSSDDDFEENDLKKQDESTYKKEWYKKNAGKLKEQYDPAKRAAKYQEEKEAKAAKKKEIANGDLDQLYEDRSVHEFINKEKNEKLYKKEWYKKNAENIKARKKESYDPVKRNKEYQEEKIRLKAREDENMSTGRTVNDVVFLRMQPG